MLCRRSHLTKVEGIPSQWIPHNTSSHFPFPNLSEIIVINNFFAKQLIGPLGNKLKRGEIPLWLLQHIITALHLFLAVNSECGCISHRQPTRVHPSLALSPFEWAQCAWLWRGTAAAMGRHQIVSLIFIVYCAVWGAPSMRRVVLPIAQSESPSHTAVCSARAPQIAFRRTKRATGIP